MRRWCCSAFSSCPPFHLRLLPSEAGHLTSFCCPPTCSFPQCFAYESNLRSHLQSATFVRKSKCFCYAFKVGWCCPWGLSFQHLAHRDFSKYLKKRMILAQRRQAFGTLFISAYLSWLLRDTWPSLLWPFSHDTPRFSSYLLILSCSLLLVSFHLPLKWWYLPPSWRRKWQPTPVLLPGESMDRGAWQGTVHRVAKSWTRLRDYHCLPPSLPVRLYLDFQDIPPGWSHPVLWLQPSPCRRGWLPNRYQTNPDISKSHTLWVSFNLYQQVTQSY